MKKLQLLLFLFLSLNINAQVNQNVTPYQLCSEPNLSGFAYFDLTSKIPEILQGQSPTENTVTFHVSLADSQTGSNPITTPTNYISPANPFMIYVRVVNVSSGDLLGLTMFLCEALPTPTANPASLFFCDPNELAIYGLSNADVQITGGEPNSFVTYYETLTNAQTGANPVGTGGYIPIVIPVQTLYARVAYPNTGCFTTTTLTLNTHNCVPCQDSAPLHLTATNITDTSLTLSWTTAFGMGNQASLISIVPYGAPPSDVDTIAVTTINSSQIITGLESENCYTIYLKGFCGTGYSNWSEPLNICMPNCANASACAEGLVLNAFLDSNNNGVKDSGEINFNPGNFVYQVNDSGNNQYGASSDGTYYIFDANPTNSYDISFAVNSELAAYYNSSVTHNNVTLPDGSGLNYLSFAVVNTTPHADAQISLYPSSGLPRPGFTYQVTIFYRNNGVLPVDGTLTFTKHPTTSIASISQSGTTATSDGFSYNFTNLLPLSYRQIVVNLSVPLIPLVNLGDYLNNTATVEINNDVNTSNNSASLSEIVVGSYDPNDMTESHGGKIVYADFTSNDYLYYTILFENTGTANAEFIRVEDALDSQLDESTFEMINASHNVNTKRVGNQLTWHFYTINLPPTVTNPNDSHGYVSFRIKPKAGYAIGDIIPNTASIYFDYNPAIVTNTFNTEFVQALGNATFNANTISLSPNPANGNVSITNSNSSEKISKITIYDVTGKRIYTLENNTLSVISIDVSHFAKGIYLIELTSDNNSKITKKLILK